MAVYFDQNGNLVDTEINESSNVFMEDPTENFYQPNNLSPTQDFYPPSQFPPTSYGFINAPQSYYPENNISPTQDFYPERNFVNAPQDYYPPDLTSLKGLDMNKFKGVSDMSVIDETTNDEQDQNYIDQVNKNKESGIMKLLKFLIPGNNLSQFLPKQSPESIAMKNFYGSQYGLTPTGQVASGIMKGYNPVSGGFLNMISGGKFGQPTQYGLAGAMQRRIENILGRKAAQTDISRARVAELRDLQLNEMKQRASGGESLSSIGKSTFTGPGMAFAPQTNTYSGGKVISSSSVPGGKYGSPK